MSAEDVSPAEPGAVLRQARETFELTQREVADALNLSVSMVDAVERGDRKALPAFVYARGYVRAYAKLLELDADRLVAAFAAAYGDTAVDEGRQQQTGTASGSRKSSALPKMPGSGSWSQRQLLMGVAIILALVLLVWWLLDAVDPAPVADVPRSTEQAATPDSDVAAPSPVIPRQPQGEQPVTADEVEAVVDTEPIDPVPAAEQASVDEAPGGLDDAERLTPTGSDRVTIAFSEDCWVEIKDLQGRLLFGDLGSAGTELNLVGQGPFRLVLGYAPGAALRFNGEPVVLSPHTRNNVASLVIGQ